MQLSDDLCHDVVFALRIFRCRPAWTAAAVITLALGIGASTAVFSAIDAVLLRPVSYPSPERIALVVDHARLGGNSGDELTLLPAPGAIGAWRRSARSFEDLEAVVTRDVTYRSSGDATESFLHAALVSPGFTAFAGQHPLLGRVFQSSDTLSGTRVALLGERLWRTRSRGASDARPVAGRQTPNATRARAFA